MKILPLALLAAYPCAAQFLSIEVAFEGIGCASCVQTLPDRIKRLRGVESASVDAEHGILKLSLAESNRVRLEQVRDMIEQDGTKAKKATVRVKGNLTQEGGRWVLKPVGLSTAYEIQGTKSALSTGPRVVDGQVENLRPESGNLAIQATRLAEP
jgi:hypothetical protein